MALPRASATRARKVLAKAGARSTALLLRVAIRLTPHLRPSWALERGARAVIYWAANVVSVPFSCRMRRLARTTPLVTKLRIVPAVTVRFAAQSRRVANLLRISDQLRRAAAVASPLHTRCCLLAAHRH